MGSIAKFRFDYALIVLFCLSSVSLSSALAQDDDPGIADTVRISCINLETVPAVGDSIGIQIYVFNDEELNAFSLGFHYDSDFIEFSTWKEEASIPAGGIHQQTIRASSNQVLLGWITFNPFGRITSNPSGARLIATMYFRVLSGATSSVIDVDTTFVPPAGSFVLSKGVGGNVFPKYRDCGVADILLGFGASCNGVFVCGDVDKSQQLNIADAVYLINYIFASGPAPQDGGRGDLNCSQQTDITDIVFLINYMFAGGPNPCLGCYESPILDSLGVAPVVIEPGRLGIISAYAHEPTGALLQYSFRIGDWASHGFFRQATWPAPQYEGDYVLEFVVSDRCDSVMAQFTVPVHHVCPVIQDFFAEREVVLPSASTYLHVDAVDPNGDDLDYAFTATGGFILASESLAVWQAPSQNGTYFSTVIVNDGVFADTSIIDIEVSNLPIIDTIRFIPDTLYVNSAVTVITEAYDPVVSELNYIYFVSVGSIDQHNTDTATWTLPNYPTTADLTVVVSNSFETIQKTITRQVVLRPTRIHGTLSLINAPNSSLVGTTVGLFSSINNWANNIPTYSSQVSTQGLSASFEFVGIAPGAYYVAAWRDADSNNLITPGDLFGWHGTGLYPLGSLIPVPISESQDVIINMDVYKY